MIKRINIKRTIRQIIIENKKLAVFWGSAEGWAPIEAANLLNRSRLDWQVSLSESLNHWTGSKKLSDGDQILAWANLGSLVEGTMTLFLAAFYEDYKKDIKAIIKKGKLIDPDRLMLEELKNFFINKDFLAPNSIKFVDMVQQRRNAIHSFRNRNIGSYLEFCKAVSKYLKFIREIDSQLLYPE